MTANNSEELRRAATRSTFLLTWTNLLTYAASFGSTLVLARLLTPREFGEVALAVVIAEFLFLLASWSLSNALIREPEESVKVAFDTSVILMCWISVTVAAVSAVIAVALSHWYSSTVALVFAAISASRIVVLFALLLLADLERRLSYGRFAIVQYGSTLLSISVAIALGYRGAGVWALASREIITGCASFVMALVFVRWRPVWVYDRTKARELLRFGAGMLGSRLGDVMFHRFDNLMVGTFAGSYQLGLYNQAYVLTDVGIKLYYPAIYQVSLPTYARLQGDRVRSSRAFRIIIFFLSRAVVPFAVLFLVIPGQLLAVVLGEQWRPAEEVLRALAFYGLLVPLLEHTRVLLVANGAIRDILVARIIQLSFFVPATVLATWRWGANGTAIVVAVAMILGSGCMYYFARRFVDIREQDFIPPLIGGLVASGLLVLLSQALDGGAILLTVGAVVAITAFVVTLLVLERSLLIEHLRVLLGSLRESRQPHEPLRSSL